MCMMANGPSMPRVKGFPGYEDFNAKVSNVPGKPGQLLTLTQEYQSTPH